MDESKKINSLGINYTTGTIWVEGQSDLSELKQTFNELHEEFKNNLSIHKEYVKNNSGFNDIQ